ncbi:hypothetical protein J5X84_08670 [Streptosporangiaceae bacterium NEAU-GS5]|nr:hypothetical protein [Streptosporangiaceae bacterium NEAU-GS5]
MKAAALCWFAAALTLAATVSACGESPTAQGRPTQQATTPRIVTTTAPLTPGVLPATTPQPTPPPAGSLSPGRGLGTVVGRVLAGPTCPVMTAEKSCPPRPVRARVAARNDSGRTIKSTKTTRDGRFTLTLPKGKYWLVAGTGKLLPRCPKVLVTVRASQRIHKTIGCDTGIR